MKYTLNENNIICCGDYNCCLLDNDRLPASQTQDNSRKAFKKMAAECGLEDTFIKAGKEIYKYTFYDKKSKTKSRLDYVFVSKRMGLVLSKFKIMKPIKGDHMAITVDLKLLDEKRGNGYWKLNNSVLNDDEYIEGIRNVVKNTLEEYKDINSYRLQWEIVKIKIKEFSIQYAVKKKRIETLEECHVQKELDKLHVKIESDRFEREELETLLKTKSELESKLDIMYREKARGAQIRARAKWVQEGEKSSKYFMRLENQRQGENVINGLYDIHGNVITDSSNILDEIVLFYSDLYTSKHSKNHNVHEFVKGVKTEVLSIRSKKLCDSNIKIEEVSEVVNNLKENKAPGLDGLTAEFYKKCWNYIDRLVYNMILETFDEGELCESMKKAVVTLIYKKGDRYSLNNYRPISLTNCDYKIIAFILANRLQRVINEIVNEDQTGYIKKRFIGHNIRLVQDIIEYTENNNISGCLISLDFEKAYDSLEWDFMIETLKKFEFGDNFIRWVNILYTDPSMIFKNNGWLSSPVHPTRGIRQGCPFSCLLFILSAEIMACSIRQNDNVRGIAIGEYEYKLSQYADDSYLFLQDIQSIDAVINFLTSFQKVSGLKLNLNKSVGIWLGNYKDHPPDYNKISFTVKPVKCLGIYVGHDKALCNEYNWRPKIDRLKIVLSSWKQRDLTIFGKSIVIKSLGICSLMFNFMLLDVDDNYIKEINRILYNFLWNNKERIQRNTLIGSVDNGGIAMIDIESKIKALKAGWIKHITNDHKWNGVLRNMLYNIGFTIDTILQCNFRSVKVFPCIESLPRFYQQVFVNFNICKGINRLEVKSNRDIFREIIWGNELFKHKGECLYERGWMYSGIIYIKDLIGGDAFVNETDILKTLKSKVNWIAEYVKIRRVVTKKLQNVDLREASYVNIKPKVSVFFINKRFTNINDLTSKELYGIFVNRKVQRSNMEHKWCNEFHIERYQSTWKDIYLRKIISNPIQKLREFNYKLINNIVICGKTVSLWNPNVSSLCEFCNEMNTVRHMLFECKRVQSVWNMYGKRIKCNIQWKHIIIGFKGNSLTCIAYNIVISIIAYNIYSEWIKCINSKKQYKNINLLQSCKNALSFHSNYLLYTSHKKIGSFITNIM